MNETADANRVVFKQPLENWRRPRDDHISLGYTTLMTTYPVMAQSCLKLQKQLRIDLSGGCYKAQCYAAIVVHAHIGLDWFPLSIDSSIEYLHAVVYLPTYIHNTFFAVAYFILTADECF